MRQAATTLSNTVLESSSKISKSTDAECSNSQSLQSIVNRCFYCFQYWLAKNRTCTEGPPRHIQKSVLEIRTA